MKVLVCHKFHGCSTGCCGHVVIVEDDAGRKTRHGSIFDSPAHPSRMTAEEVRAFVIERVTDELGEEHVKDIDWDRCEVLDD